MLVTRTGSGPGENGLGGSLDVGLTQALDGTTTESFLQGGTSGADMDLADADRRADFPGIVKLGLDLENGDPGFLRDGFAGSVGLDEAPLGLEVVLGLVWVAGLEAQQLTVAAGEGDPGVIVAGSDEQAADGVEAVPVHGA